jgi:hypothetical protein
MLACYIPAAVPYVLVTICVRMLYAPLLYALALYLYHLGNVASTNSILQILLIWRPSGLLFNRFQGRCFVNEVVWGIAGVNHDMITGGYDHS